MGWIGACLVLSIGAGCSASGRDGSAPDSPAAASWEDREPPEAVPASAASCAEFDESDTFLESALASHFETSSEALSGNAAGAVEITFATGQGAEAVINALGNSITAARVQVRNVDGALTAYVSALRRTPDQSAESLFADARIQVVDTLRMLGSSKSEAEANDLSARADEIEQGGTLEVIGVSTDLVALRDAPELASLVYDVAVPNPAWPTSPGELALLPPDEASLLARERSCGG